MKSISQVLLSSATALSVVLVTASFSTIAQAQSTDKAITYPAVAQADPNAPGGAPKMSDLTAGEVQKVDKGANQLTIKHGAIKSLDLPSSTILFTVRDPAILDTVQPGDKVKFKAMNDGGKVVVTEFEVVK
jgi:Cu(I)/Ag(I) efflux system periplasmic protein CusF